MKVCISRTLLNIPLPLQFIPIGKTVIGHVVIIICSNCIPQLNYSWIAQRQSTYLLMNLYLLLQVLQKVLLYTIHPCANCCLCFACLCLPLPASASLCLPLLASACLCLTLPASACPACMHACMHVCMHACMHACLHTCMHACMHYQAA